MECAPFAHVCARCGGHARGVREGFQGLERAPWSRTVMRAMWHEVKRGGAMCADVGGFILGLRGLGRYNRGRGYLSCRYFNPLSDGNSSYIGSAPDSPSRRSVRIPSIRASEMASNVLF